MEKRAEHTEEGLSSSQSIVGRDDGYHAAERVQQRPRSPVQSCVSLKSDQSMDPKFLFKHRDSRTLQRSQSWESLKSDWSMEPPFHFKHRVQQRPRSPVQSCVSLKSDQSMDPKFLFKHRDSRTLQRSQSWESLKSDWSMEPPFHFKHRVQQRPRSPVQSCVSLKSDQSMDPKFLFKHRRSQSWESLKSYWSMEPPFHFKHRIVQRPPSCESLKSDWSMEAGPVSFTCGQTSNQSDQQRSEVICPTYQGSVLALLEKKMVAFVKKELKVFTRLLSPDYQDFSSESRDDGAEVDSEEAEQCRSSKEALAKFAIHFLRMMKRNDLAECLQLRTSAVRCQYKLKSNLKEKYQCVFEGITKAGTPALLNQIYTELYITEGEAGGVNDEHEVRQIEIPSRKPARLETTISCKDIFQPLPARDRQVRTLMTKGVAGIGKTVLTQKVTLNWAENKTHHRIQFIFPFTFRELNVLKEKRFSLVEFVHHFFHEIKEAGSCSFEDSNVVFIFDGLDECRLPLDFDNNPTLTDVTESVSVDVLLTNIITGKLLPNARLWITTRPAAANQIPAKYVDMVTEVRGFNDPQKEEYFRKRFSDEKQVRKIIAHIKKSRSVHIMCHIPVFCWITATVLEEVIKTKEGARLPKNLTEMYIHFLVVQAKLKNVKYDKRSETDPHWSPESRKMIESLGKLAFEQLQKGNLIFYESDLTECGIDIRSASVYSGVFTEFFREEKGLYQEKMFCFIHLSVQEFLAALHVHLTFFNTGVNLLETQLTTQRPKPVTDKAKAKLFYQAAVVKALESPNGHLDLFLRFLLGLSVQNNQTLLHGLMKQIQRSSQISQEAVLFIKEKISQSFSTEMTINLFHCLFELNDQSLVDETQRFLSSGNLRQDRLSPAQWSALVFILLSEKEVDVFDLKKFSPSEEGLLRLLPVVKVSRKSLLSGCILSKTGCTALASLLRSQSCLLRELDLSYTEMQDSGLTVLSDNMTSEHCKLEVLRLNGCKLTSRSCCALSSVLSSQFSKLKELDLSNNSLKREGVVSLSTGLQSPHCKMEILKCSGCNLFSDSCDALASVLRCQSSSLRELDLSNNDLQDSGVHLLATGLQSSHCVLETLSLSGCLLTENSCTSLVSALISNPHHLRELDLSYNHPGASGMNALCDKQKDPNYKLDIVRTDYAGVHRLKPGVKKYACQLSLDSATAHPRLCLFDNNTVTDEDEDQPYAKKEDRFQFWYQVLCSDALRGRCYWEVAWMGLVSVGVAYSGTRRTGRGEESMLGGNTCSWTLDCSADHYCPWHQNKGTSIQKPIPDGTNGRVGLYLDWSAGTISFYAVSSDRLEHIHTFYCSFTEPVYPALRIRSEFTYGCCNSVSLCPMDQD
ncbi:NACHT, LRR and PYD domains-containing protein 3-like isoform X3 [Sphaeramia orbicularis]|uniref:NACHT, LRR and PYD domains-containing protein 3-like n=1 Tax=Sphaeramia orbicularis TaxID=375764 RepID=A0A672YVG7_9TELE|nr:NACHT, LRR and PYD domains-containing protein 3-like isoform X3 [Sphaeramia orbicularis]